jgi:hypothetical protein
MTADVVIEEIIDNPLKWPRAFFLGALGASDFQRKAHDKVFEVSA